VCKLWVSEFKQFTVFQDLIGFNLYGMQFMQREIETVEGVQLFRDATVEKKKGDKKKKQRQKLKRSMIVLNS
jgi:U3 small nucleolar RNA-associated protein 12